MQGAGELNKIYGMCRKRLEIQEQVMALEETINEETHDLDNHHNQGDMKMEEIQEQNSQAHEETNDFDDHHNNCNKKAQFSYSVLTFLIL